MKNSTLGLLMIVLSLGFSATAENPTIFEKKSAHDFTTSVKLITEAVKEAGWTIPTEFDMQANLRKGGHDVLPFQIFVLCHSGYAKQVLENDDARLLAAIMPCRIGVYEKQDGSAYISWSNLQKLGEELGEPSKNILKNVAKEIDKIAEGVTK